jgi:hypothetical protein
MARRTKQPPAPASLDALDVATNQYLDWIATHNFSPDTLACLVSGRTRLLGLIDAAVIGECQRLKLGQADFRFSRKDVRAWAQWGDTVLKKHLGRLEDTEYLVVHRGGRGQSFVYELLPGPMHGYDEKKSPLEEEKSPLSRG